MNVPDIDVKFFFLIKGSEKSFIMEKIQLTTHSFCPK